VIPLVALLLSQAPAAPAAAPSPDPPRFAVTFGVERRDEHVRYHFTNDSNFDTAALVPHFFEQKYDASNTWIVFGADYRLAGAAARTEVAWAPARTTAGSDLDTFFDPGGDVIVSGTDGTVSMGSLAVSQRFGITRWHDWTLGVTVGYRRSRAEFPPDFIVVTHTTPPSTSRTFTTDRETTWSQVIESGFTADRRWMLDGRWCVAASAEALPITRGRLTISLPDKYPGMDINAEALAFGAHGRVAIERAVGSLTIGAGATFGGAWSYQAKSAYTTHSVGVIVYLEK
jgi:hypothetical protein